MSTQLAQGQLPLQVRFNLFDLPNRVQLHPLSPRSIDGSSPNASRPLDSFGIGYAFTRYSSPVRDFAPALLPVGDDQVVELFYNIAVTPWMNFAPNLQVVVPARESTFPLAYPHETETALVLGVRGRIEF